MGCNCSFNHRIKNSNSIEELIDNIEHNISLIRKVIINLPFGSRNIYCLGKRVVRINEALVDTLQRLDSISDFDNNWHEVRDLSDFLFEYFFFSFNSIDKNSIFYEEEFYNNDFSNTEKKLYKKKIQLRKQINIKKF